MDMSNYYPNPSIFITVIKQDDKWIAMGSNKVDLFELTASRDDTFVDVLSFASRSIYPMMTTYMINGRTRTIATATAATQLSAVGALLDFFKEDEIREAVEQERKTQRQADYTRFGGEVNEELIRKVVRWRKKQAKKAEQEREYDPDREWEF